MYNSVNYWEKCQQLDRFLYYEPEKLKENMK